MTIRIGINGFGRIGRLAYRRIREVGSDLEVVAVNDLTSPKVLAHLLQHDTTFRNFPDKVEATEDSIVVDGKPIRVYAERNAENIPWGTENVDIVIESTGFYTSEEKSSAHLRAGAKKVLISAPAGNMKTIVYSVNDDTLNKDDKIISVASCTTNCLAPMTKAINDSFGIKLGTMTTIHAYTGTQMLVDGPRGNNLRAARAAAVIDGSVTELVSILSKKVTAEEVNEAIKKATIGNESFGYTDEEIVSSDIIGTDFGSIFDATQTEVTTYGDLQLVKTVAWYDNEHGFTSQMIRTLVKYVGL